MNDTRRRILETTAELFRRQGFHGTGLKQVAAAGDAPIGSLYHHFPGGKTELAAETLRTSGLGYQLLVEEVVDSKEDLADGVREAFSLAAEVLEATDYADACPIATVALEVASTDDALRQVTADVFSSWHAALVRRALAAGVGAEPAEHLAYLFVAALEGGFMLSRAAKDTTPMRALGHAVGAFVDVLLDDGRETHQRNACCPVGAADAADSPT